MALTTYDLYRRTRNLHADTILTGVLAEGLVMACIGVAAGAAGGLGLSRVIGRFIPDVQLPGLPAVAGSAGVLLAAAVIASMLPASRAARVDVVQALRAD